MSTIQLTPQLHHAVKWAKENATGDALNVDQSISSRISASESKALTNIFKKSNVKTTQAVPYATWY